MRIQNKRENRFSKQKSGERSTEEGEELREKQRDGKCGINFFFSLYTYIYCLMPSERLERKIWGKRKIYENFA